MQGAEFEGTVVSHQQLAQTRSIKNANSLACDMSSCFITEHYYGMMLPGGRILRIKFTALRACTAVSNLIVLLLLQVSVLAYGAFVDIGSVTDGLVHVSQMTVSLAPSFDAYQALSALSLPCPWH